MGIPGSFPIAEVVNSDFDAIAFTSFEKVDNGNWTYSASLEGDAVTGSNSFMGSVETSISFRPGTYLVSFWAKGQGNVTIGNDVVAINSATKWERYSQKITLSNAGKISLSTGVVKIDELRAHPINGRMKSFTYSSNAFSMTSASDASNTPTTYEFDNLSRLGIVRDENSDILNKYTYNVAGSKNSFVPGSNVIATFPFSGITKTNEIITFSADNNVSGADYEWDFGDGTVTKTQSKIASHEYSTTGKYFVKLTVFINGVGNYSVGQIKIDPATSSNSGTWGAPIVTINEFKHQSFPLPAFYSIRATATPSTGGTTPYKKYNWRITDENGKSIIGLLTDKATTTEPVVNFTLLSNTGMTVIINKFKIWCTITDDNDVVSKEGSASH